MQKLVPLLLLVAAVCCEEAEDYISESVLLKIFGPPPTSNESTGAGSARLPRAMRTPDSVYEPCEMDNGEPGRCVPYYFCPISTPRPSWTIDIAIQEGGPCISPVDVCCIPPSKFP